MTNHKYEQIPLNEEMQGANSHQRSALEASFDINEDEDTQEAQPMLQQQAQQHMAPPPQSTDGVFSNMSAKPESESTKNEEALPAYEEAAADTTPPYWQTTIIAPTGFGDLILVEGLPVGSIVSFLWNLMVSASFQLVGFMLTYLLHTTHAGKNGALAGLGVSLIQYGFYIRSRGTLEEDFDYDGKGHELEDPVQAEIVAYLMMFIGWFIILRAVTEYNKARKMESIICSEPTVESIV